MSAEYCPECACKKGHFASCPFRPLAWAVKGALCVVTLNDGTQVETTVSHGVDEVGGRTVVFVAKATRRDGKSVHGAYAAERVRPRLVPVPRSADHGE